MLPSVFDVTGLATASVGIATAAVAGFVAARTGAAAPTRASTPVRASAAFIGELLFAPRGWERPAIFDPVAGDYQAADGWIRLHTNYAAHRAAALAALGLPDDAATDRDAVAAVVRRLPAAELEAAVVDRGGAAAAMHDAATWRAHPHGVATAEEPAVRVHPLLSQTSPPRLATAGARPLGGVQVLDLTRVIAGPVCTRFLAAHGADVLRLDPPGFAEVAAIVPVVTPGKRCAALDLAAAGDRDRFADLVAGADVVVTDCGRGRWKASGSGRPSCVRSIPASSRRGSTPTGGAVRGHRGAASTASSR